MRYILLMASIIGSWITFNQVQMEGLWLVEKVKVGEEIVTPVGRWTRFTEDGTYVSGNGWKQHTYGNWSLTDGKLSMIAENSPVDTYEPFQMDQSDPDRMTWTREEDGMRVEVHLSRIYELPTTPADQILGMWEVQSNPANSILSHEGRVTLFLRWDNVCVITTPEEKYYGVYRIHGHRSELQWFPYDDNLQREFWTFEFDQGGELVLKSDDGPIAVLTRTGE